jgi:hypothetical protein
MSRFASRELSFVSFGSLRSEPTTNTQNCFAEEVTGHCTCCTNNTAVKKKRVHDRDLSALQQQLRAALT